MSHVYVLVEHDAGQLNPVTAELITAARPLGMVSAVVVGAPGSATPLAAELGALGAEQVIDAGAADYGQRFLLPEVDALHILGAANPAPIVVAATAEGNEIAGRLAGRLASGALANVVAINPDRTARHLLFGGQLEATAAAHGACPIYTLRPGALTPVAEPASGTLAPMQLPAATAKDARVLSFTPAAAADRPALSQAKAIVAGGRGVGSAEGFREVVEPLADVLTGAVGVTRDVADEGWYEAKYQIGQTGETVSPDLYIGVGISGAIQHTSGMQSAGTIVAINQDVDEPIFQIADLGVVGDLHEIVPALTEELNSRK